MFGRDKLIKITTAVLSVFLYYISQERLLVSAGFPGGYNVISYWGQVYTLEYLEYLHIKFENEQETKVFLHTLLNFTFNK